MANNLGEVKQIVVIDSQKLSMIQSCQFKYDLTFNRDIVPVEKAEPLENGDLAHKMLETYYKMHKYITRWPRDFDRTKVFKICERVAEYHATKLQLPLDEIDNTINSFKQYLEYYWGERYQTLAVEQVASRVLYEDSKLIILYDAKIDWIVSLGNVPIMPSDHKTTKRNGPTSAMSNQFMGYCWILDVCNIMVNKFGLQTSLPPKQKFNRPIISYSPGVIDEWVKNSVWWVKHLIECRETGVWPQNFTSCDKFNKMCRFAEICSASPEARPSTIAQLFDISPSKWDVGANL